MHAARVLGDVAADRTGDLRRWIGRVVQAMRCGGLGNRQVAHARLHHCGARERVELQDAGEARQRQQHAARVRQRPARQAGTRTARHHRHAQLEAGAQHRDHLLLGGRQRHHQRQRPVGGQAVAFVGAQVLGVVHQRAGRQHAGQRRDHPRLVHRRKIALGLTERQRFVLQHHPRLLAKPRPSCMRRYTGASRSAPTRSTHASEPRNCRKYRGSRPQPV